MSNYLAIAMVTETLRQILYKAIQSEISGAGVTTVRPSSTQGASGGLPSNGINLFLYQIVHAAAQENLDLPLRRSDGSLTTLPRAALNLHYLLSFYNDKEPLTSQKLMGLAVARLHSHPLLTREDIRTAKMTATSPLQNSNLDEEIDFIRITPEVHNLEDFSKLWSVFFQTPYVLSATYQASIVYVEDTAEPPGSALPVQQALVTVESFRQPVLSQVLPESLHPEDPVLPGQLLILRGRNLLGAKTLVRINGVVAEPASVTMTEVQVQLSEPPFPKESLRAGVQAVQVVQNRMLGLPATEHRGLESNMLAFVLVPQIGSPSLAAVSVQTVNNQVLCSGTLTLSGIFPGVGARQKVAVLLSEWNPPSDRSAYNFILPVTINFDEKLVKSVSSLSVDFKNVPESDYLIRLRVDGGESPLEITESGGGPLYSGPLLSIKGTHP